METCTTHGPGLAATNTQGNEGPGPENSTQSGEYDECGANSAKVRSWQRGLIKWRVVYYKCLLIAYMKIFFLLIILESYYQAAASA